MNLEPYEEFEEWVDSGPSTAESSAASSQLPSSASSVASVPPSKSLKDDILAQELENQQLKQELLVKKHKLADLQIEYWTKRLRHL
ncbi:hypothetical protein GCK32_014190 [Trichostrongylus colubriformis]|uniref:Uncharacterized protein n=1 Tax=Trichostrongylus colubriformis TaxID=6319 RepID=A0AAN8GCU4_TRICO